jgi:hypothetical protein
MSQIGEIRRFLLSPTAYFAGLAAQLKGVLSVMIEAGVIAGYMIAWAVRKARRVADRLDHEADAVVDVGLDRLHALVATRLADHPVLARLQDEAEQAALNDDGYVSPETRRQVELALAATARTDEAFGHAVMELAAGLANAPRTGSDQPSPRHRAVVFAGKSRAEADRGGIAFGQVAGDVHIAREAGSPLQPGRFGH